jgi:hypothetical protein
MIAKDFFLGKGKYRIAAKILRDQARRNDNSKKTRSAGVAHGISLTPSSRCMGRKALGRNWFGRMVMGR